MRCIGAQTLVSVLLRRVDDTIKVEVVHWAAYYDHRMELGSKPIFHIEAFIAKFMAMYGTTHTQRCNALREATGVNRDSPSRCICAMRCVCSYKRFVVESFG